MKTTLKKVDSILIKYKMPLKKFYLFNGILYVVILFNLQYIFLLEAFRLYQVLLCFYIN